MGWLQSIVEASGYKELTKPPKPANNEGLSARRLQLLNGLKKNDFAWFPLKLEGAMTSSGKPEQIEIEVCNPVKVRQLYLPVTGHETKQMAIWMEAYPLTAAVADRLFQMAHTSPMKNQDNLVDFYSSSDTFHSVYWPYETYKPVFGAHKLWLLSNHGRRNVDCKPIIEKPGARPKHNPALPAPPSPNQKSSQRPLVFGLQRVEACNNEPSVNYGFYKNRSKTDTRPNGGAGPAAAPNVAVEQSLGGKHNAHHWDYSQLLQLMRFKNLPGTNNRILEYGGQKYSMSMAIKAGLPFLWDEPTLLTSDDLDW